MKMEICIKHENGPHLTKNYSKYFFVNLTGL